MIGQDSGIKALISGLHKHADALSSAAAMCSLDEMASEADKAIQQMLKRASELVRAAGLLGEQRNPTALAVISRAILENLILMLWVQVDEDNAVTLKKTAMAEFMRAAKVNFEKGRARVIDRESGQDATAKFLESDRFKNMPRRMSIESRAKEAGVEDLYTVFYRFMSLDTHGHGSARTDEDFEKTTLAHVQGVGALALASGHVGVRWLLHRQRTDNETLRGLLGIGTVGP